MMIWVLISLSIRVFQRNSIEISETVSDAENIFNNQSIRPFENKFNMAVLFELQGPVDE